MVAKTFSGCLTMQNDDDMKLYRAGTLKYEIAVGKPEKLWGAPAIAQALGVSVATVYRFALETDCPIYRPSARYFAYRSELENWLRTAA